MKRLKLLSASTLALMMVAGCNTVAGLGKDLQAAGGAISDTSTEVKDFLVGTDGPVETASNDAPDR